MKSTQSVSAYLAALPEDRRAAIGAVRDVVNAQLPAGYEEGMRNGMICWYVPLTRLANTHDRRPLGLAALASRKGQSTLFLFNVYNDRKLRTWFEAAFTQSGKQLHTGMSCVLFRTADDLPLAVIGEAVGKVGVDAYVNAYLASNGRAVSANIAAKKAESARRKKEPSAEKVKAKRKAKGKRKAKQQ